MKSKDAGGWLRRGLVLAMIALIWDVSACRAADEARELRVTGTVEPAEVVDVCARVNGLVANLGPDPRASSDPAYAGKTIDFGTAVKAGTLLARLDEAPFRDSLLLAKANLERAKAELERAQSEAELAEAKARDAAARRRAGLDAPDVTDATIKLARANVHVAEAGIEQAKVSLVAAQRDLDNTRIVAPVDGIIIDRRIEVGQSVPALQGATLFLIARTPLRLQVWASIPEAQIARVHTGQTVRITCAASPQKTYTGTVQQIRPNATMIRNSVEYTTVIPIDGDTDPLIPYLTAEATITTDP